MNFKDILAHDIHAVFLNPEEMSELRTIRYDGAEYPDIPVSLQELEEADRQRLSASGFGRGRTDGATGLHQVQGVLFCAVADLGGKVLKQGSRIQLNSHKDSSFFQTYRVGLVGNEMGILRIELEAIAE